MKLTIKAKLLTIPEQHQSLKKTMEAFNDACGYISQKAFQSKTFNQVKLHHLIYYEARKQFPSLSSQFIVRAIAKVSDSYVAEKKILHKFKLNVNKDFPIYKMIFFFGLSSGTCLTTLIM